MLPSIWDRYYYLPRATNPNTTRVRSSCSYLVLLHVRCRPFHPDPFESDSSLLPSLTSRWVVVNHYVTLCSSDVPLLNFAFNSDNPSISIHCQFIFSFSFSYKLVLPFGIEPNFPALQAGTMTTLVQVAF